MFVRCATWHGGSCLATAASSWHILILVLSTGPWLQVLVRMSLGMDASGSVAMKLIVRGDSAESSEAVHSIIQNA
jgi:hypothetical protein